ncbi:hypothetical protein [Nostoc sp. UHCC 0870]|uniref:hypothetical protein n=1 Tax=Nostoc sp. UHCC 0870 TaxID=2914041 RepID=UPI001EE03C27|nr:hypothetical protein [Nostoc sp. UHCC 0870]UKP01270.1 hypothetical protein L6494_28610 [Nostoc sp. UHCC 0870]
MKPTKKPELLSLKKAIPPQLPQELIEDFIPSQPIADLEQSVDTESPATEYLQSYPPGQDYPTFPSAGNSGWQASDIWRELRVDGFCD